jgi:hypothetical protein
MGRVHRVGDSQQGGESCNHDGETREHIRAVGMVGYLIAKIDMLIAKSVKPVAKIVMFLAKSSDLLVQLRADLIAKILMFLAKIADLLVQLHDLTLRLIETRVGTLDELMMILTKSLESMTAAFSHKPLIHNTHGPWLCMNDGGRM